MAADATAPRPTSSLRTDWLLLLGFCLFLFFFGLSYFGLIGADEPRYAQVAREMFERHDWVTPTLAGKAWLEKPALYYWQAMLAYAIFGVSDWAARIPSALDASLMVIGIYLFLRRFRTGSEIDGALMTASSAAVVGFARAASTDMPLAAAFTLAMLAWYAWFEKRSKLHLTLFWIFVGLGMLAKGPVAPVLAAVIIGLFAVARRDYSLFWRTLWFPGLLIFCALALPWYVAVQVKNPEFLRVFLLQHNLARFGTNLYHHKEPFWFYLPVALLGLVPWTVFAMAGAWEFARVWWNERMATFESEDALQAFLLIWLIVPVLFFSISQSKLPGYILPALPAATILVALYARNHLEEDRPNSFILILHSIVAATSIVAALMIQYLVLQHRLPWGKAAAISTTFAVLLAMGIFVTLRTRLGLRMLRFVTLVPVVLSVGAALRLGSPAIDSTFSARPLAKELSQMETRPLPIAVFEAPRETEYGLAFYRNQPISRYETGGIPPVEHLVVAPSGSQTVVAKAVPGRRVSYLGSFAPQGLDYFWVSAAQNGR
jgi:4-amino-4-deoxy-L-arabinose transferase-like glycosyltransferase